MTLLITNQQRVAKQVLLSLRGMFGNAEVAGGAPRDWYLGKCARDIDIYVRWRRFDVLVKERIQIALNKPDVIKLGKDYDEVSSVVPEFMGCYYFDTQGIPFNTIFLNEDIVTNVTDHFDCNLSKIMWDGENLLYGDEFLNSLSNKQITFYRSAPKHEAKMREYFPEFEIVGGVL